MPSKLVRRKVPTSSSRPQLLSTCSKGIPQNDDIRIAEATFGGRFGRVSRALHELATVFILSTVVSQLTLKSRGRSVSAASQIDAVGGNPYVDHSTDVVFPCISGTKSHSKGIRDRQNGKITFVRRQPPFLLVLSPPPFCAWTRNVSSSEVEKSCTNATLADRFVG